MEDNRTLYERNVKDCSAFSHVVRKREVIEGGGISSSPCKGSQYLKNKYEIVVASDSNYCQHVAVLFLSVIHTNPDAEITFHFLSMECEGKELERIRESIRQYSNAKLRVYPITEDTFMEMPVNSFYSRAIFARFLIPTLLADIDKVLYLDVDIIVNGSLEEIWETDLTDYSCAGVYDLKLEFTRPVSYLGFDVKKEGFINSGVILMNNKYWRDNEVSKKLCEIVVSRAAEKVLDQDAINMLLHGTIKILHPRWNFTTGYFAFPPLCLDEYRKYIRPYWHKAAIHHFVGPVKPWHRDSGNPNTSLYRRYRRETPWRNTPLEWHEANPMKGRYMLLMRKLKNIVAYICSCMY